MRTKTFKSAEYSNKKKQMVISYTSGKKVSIHYGSIGIKQNIEEVWVDKETGGKSLGIRLADGSLEYMPYDQPLAISGDPEFTLQNHIERIIAKIKEEIERNKISKKYLAQQLKTSDNQVQRLLNPDILNKNLPQLYKVASLLGLEFEINLKNAA
jgi:hypothetical protein